MLHCYLSDTSLFSPNIEDPSTSTNITYDQFTTFGKGVGQITERVLSMFNTKYSTGLITDPRTVLGRNERITNLFKSYGIGYRSYGQMCLHYDKYFAEKEGYAVDEITDQTVIKRLFDVIEICLMSHEYDPGIGKWKYASASDLDIALSGYSADANGYGYAGDLHISAVRPEHDKKAKVKLINTTGVITTTLGTGEVSTADILFPSYVEFKFQYEIGKIIPMRIYFDPETLLTEYPNSYITSIIFPTNPEDLMNLRYDTVLESLKESSCYVGNVMTHEVTKSDTNVLDTTNHTGAATYTTSYRIGNTDTNLTFTCTYKGRVPTQQDISNAVRDYLLALYPGQEEQIDDILPGLRISSAFIVIPFYNTRSVVNTVANTTICENILSLGYINRIVERVAQDKRCTTMLNIAGYNMHAFACPVPTTDELTHPLVDDIPSTHGLDSLDEFETYQAISTESPYWINMTDEEQDLNRYLSKIVAAELKGHSPLDINYQIEVLDINGIACRFYSFTIDRVNFNVITQQSFNALVGV